MTSRFAPRLLTAPLCIALIAAPSVVQEGLVSLRWMPLWVPWGVPLLAATGVFAILAGVFRGIWALGASKPRRREQEAQDEDGPGEETGEQEKANEDEAAPEDGPDAALYEALGDLEPENYMDLVRALQEMERHGEALEVLARIAEMQGGERSAEFARALRRTGRQWRQAPPPDA